MAKHNIHGKTGKLMYNRRMIGEYRNSCYETKIRKQDKINRQAIIYGIRTIVLEAYKKGGKNT